MASFRVGSSAVGGTDTLAGTDLAPVSDSLDLRWSVRTAVADSVDLRWSVIGKVSDSLDLRWSVRTLVSDTRDVRWSIRIALVDDLELLWGVTGVVFVFQPPVTHSTPLADPYPFATREERVGLHLQRHVGGHPVAKNIYLLNDGTLTTRQPYDMTTVARIFYGGHIEPVSTAERALLVAAGYTVTTEDA